MITRAEDIGPNLRDLGVAFYNASGFERQCHSDERPASRGINLQRAAQEAQPLAHAAETHPTPNRNDVRNNFQPYQVPIFLMKKRCVPLAFMLTHVSRHGWVACPIGLR